MKIQIIPDVHNRWQAVEKHIRQEKPDRVILLGDYYDFWEDETVDAYNISWWLKDSLADETREHCIGNHDIWYGYSWLVRPCSGNTRAKRDIIQGILNDTDWQKMKLAYRYKNVLFSHAGIKPAIFQHPIYGLDWQWLQVRLERAMHTPNDPVFDADYMRGGSAKWAGILWQDWRNIAWADGWNQIVGHTPSKRFKVKYLPNQKDARHFNLCLDTSSRGYGIIEDDKVFAVDLHMKRTEIFNLTKTQN